MATDSTEELRMNFEYEVATNYKEVFVNGSICSPTPTGEIFCQIYSERVGNPESFVAIMTPETYQESPDEGQRPHMVRTIHAGLFLNRSQAKILGQWLISAAEALHSGVRE